MRLSITLLILTLPLVGSLFGQNSFEPLKDAKSGKFRADPYLVFPNMNGNTAIARLPLIAVDASPSDIFSNLQIGGMLYLEASKGKWSVGSDMLFMNLQQDATPGTITKAGEVKAKQFFWDLAGYR